MADNVRTAGHGGQTEAATEHMGEKKRARLWSCSVVRAGVELSTDHEAMGKGAERFILTMGAIEEEGGMERSRR